LNSLAGKGDGLLQLLEQEGIMLERVEGIPNLFKTKTNVGKLLRSQNYQNGSFSILDKSSMLAVICCDPKPGYLVADICAAPGNKTGLLAQLMGNRGTIYSIDRSIRRMTLWKREMKRLGIRIAHGIVADATTPIPLKLEADVVLVDPPCSNSGVFSKMPSMKWRINRQKLKNLCRIQASILENSSLLLRSGGILVYSTCSVLAEENEMIVEAFLHLHPEMKLVEIEQKFGTAGMRGLEFCRRLYPNSDECNGSFIAKIVREH
jgi:16S rRNA (cytosine967-C5)-methyltransferase